MTAAPVLTMTAPGRPWIFRPGYLILTLCNGAVALLALLLIVGGCTSVADGWGGGLVLIVDLLLIGAHLPILLAVIIYTIVQARRHPVRAGHPMTWLLILSFCALALAVIAAVVFCVVPHKGAC